MEQQVPPPVTITGGPGWVVGAPGAQPATGSSDVTGADAPPRRPVVRQALVLVAAFAVGFAASQLLSDERRTGLSRSPQGQLSLALDGAARPDYVTDQDGRLAVALSLVVRNTGPADVVLEAASVGGLSDAGVQGRTLLPEAATRISLTRAVDCAQLPAAAEPVGPLVVRARTPAGSQEARLPLDADPGRPFARRLREACGQVPAEAALTLGVELLSFDGDAARLPLELRNTSARDLLVTEIRPRAGVLLELLDDSGAAVALPLRLPAADYRVPHPPDDPTAAPPVRLTAVLRLTSCDRRPDGGAPDRPLLELSVIEGEEPATVPYGDGRRLLQRLTETSCPAGTAAG